MLSDASIVRLDVRNPQRYRSLYVVRKVLLPLRHSNESHGEVSYRAGFLSQAVTNSCKEYKQSFK